MGAYLSKPGERNLNWDKSLIHDEYIKDPHDETTKERKISKNVPPPIVTPPPPNEMLEMTICGDCEM